MVDCVLDALCEVGFQLDGCNRQSVEEQDQVDTVLILERIANLPNNTQSVRGVTNHDLRVDLKRRLDLHHGQFAALPQHFEPIAKHVKRSALVDRVPQTANDHFTSVSAMALGSRLPSVRLRFFEPGKHIVRKQCPSPIVSASIAIGIEPTTVRKVLADGVFEVDFGVDGHLTSFLGTFVAR